MAIAGERILNWNSDIIIRQDASMRVVDQLTVLAQGQHIKHGIMRTFPTKYHDALGLRYNVNFSIIETLLDGNQIDHQTADYMNGVRVTIGKKEQLVKPGIHVYTIVYETDRQLGFFEDHDELYYNVIGLGWPFFIDKAHVRVNLPEQIPVHKIHAEAYTGSLYQKNHDYTVKILENGTIEFETTGMLAPRQGLTIVISWPKGFVQQVLLFGHMCAIITIYFCC